MEGKRDLTPQSGDAADGNAVGKMIAPGLETHIDYIQSTHSHEFREYSDEEVAELGKILLSTDTSDAHRKQCLGILAHLGTVTACQILSDYEAVAVGEEMKIWAELAKQECRMFLEMDLTDESQAVISSGLGVDANRIRFFYLVLPLPGQKFHEGQEIVVRIAFEEVAKNFGCDVEEVVFNAEHIGITALVPMDVAPGDFVLAAIGECNLHEEMVLEYYYSTNVRIPVEEEVKEIISIIMAD
jgi:hypothetical protein